MSARGVWCQITLPEGRTPRGKGYLTQTRGLTPSRGSNSVINQILYLIKHLALYLLVFSHVCWCIPRPFVCAGHQNPFIGQGQGYSICKFTYLASYWWSLDKGVLMQMSFAIDWQVTRSFILHSFTPKSNVENVPHRSTCKHNPNCDNVGMTLLFHTVNLQF